MPVIYDANRPAFLEYKQPRGRERKLCCYKDSPCETHKDVLNNLVRMAIGEIEADLKNLQKKSK